MTHAHWLIAGLIIILAAWASLYHLGAAPLQDYDEATYAQVTHEMRESGNLFLLTHTGEPYLEKPPLYFWLADMSETAFGTNEFALRLPSALSAVALIALVMLLAYELSANAEASLLAGAILLTTAPLIETARQMRIDVPVTFFIVLALYGFVRALQQPKWFLLFGAALGFAILTKSVVAIFAFVAAIAVALVVWRWNWIKNAWFWAGIVLCTLIAAPWHMYESLEFGRVFWYEYFEFDVVERSAQDIFMVRISNADYIWYLSNFAAPWTQTFIVCAAGVAIWWRAMVPKLRAAALVSLMTVASVVVVFFCAETKAPTYLVPLYPFAAMFIALCIAELRTHVGRSGKLVLAGATVALLALGAASVWYNGFHHNPYYGQADELAVEEKIIGTSLANTRGTLYAFQTTTLGSIMYYSGDTHPISFEGTAPTGSYVVLPTKSLTPLAELYPQTSTIILYKGEQLTLIGISG